MVEYERQSLTNNTKFRPPAGPARQAGGGQGRRRGRQQRCPLDAEAGGPGGHRAERASPDLATAAITIGISAISAVAPRPVGSHSANSPRGPGSAHAGAAALGRDRAAQAQPSRYSYRLKVKVSLSVSM
jgi:hypothetical protein